MFRTELDRFADTVARHFKVLNYASNFFRVSWAVTGVTAERAGWRCFLMASVHHRL